MKITIMMPALNEEDSVGKTLSMIPVDELTKSGYEPEIMVIDGGSTDKTVEIARSSGAKVICCHRGYGRQYKAGFENATGEIIVTADSDCSYPMEEIPSLLRILTNENLDFIHTNRFAFMEKKAMMSVNKFGNIVLTVITNLLFNFNFKDSQSGMWVFRKDLLDKIILHSNGMALSQEIKIKAFKYFKAREINSTYRKRIGRVKLRIFADGTGNLLNLFKLKFAK
jgi:cellulose synthase/poly-beta-1,6-N-acetylglucosamine synthase-like glycosyltransferase